MVVAPSSRMVRVLVVHHHTVFREALALVLQQHLHFAEVVEVGSLAGAGTVVHNSATDIALVDIDVPDGHGTDLVRDLRYMSSACTILALTGSISPRVVEAVREAGVAALRHKTVGVAELVGWVRSVAMGKSVLPGHTMTGPLPALESAPSVTRALTARERELLQALAEGLSDAEIAVRLDVRPQTVRKYLLNIFGKLGVASRLQAVIFAVRHGLVRLH